MRRARPHELKTSAMPAMTARLTEAELLRWVPVPFDDITDPLATPEPSKGALVKLESGGYVVLFYGKDSQQLTVEIPERTKDASALLSDFFDEVPLPRSRVLWHRADIAMPKHRRHAGRSGTAPAKDRGKAITPKRSARTVSLPKRSK